MQRSGQRWRQCPGQAGKGECLEDLSRRKSLEQSVNYGNCQQLTTDDRVRGEDRGGAVLKSNMSILVTELSPLSPFVFRNTKSYILGFSSKDMTEKEGCNK